MAKQLKDHECIKEEDIDGLKEVIKSLKDVPNDIRKIKDELVGTEYTMGKGLIHQVAESKEAITKIREEYAKDRAYILGWSVGVAVATSLIWNLLFK